MWNIFRGDNAGFSKVLTFLKHETKKIVFFCYDAVDNFIVISLNSSFEVV